MELQPKQPTARGPAVQINHIIATNLPGSIRLIRAVLPHLCGRRAAVVPSVDQEPGARAPAHVPGSQALQAAHGVLRERIASFEAQAGLAASTDLPTGE